MSSFFVSVAVTCRPLQSLVGPENQNLAIKRDTITITRMNRAITNAFFTASLSSHPPGLLCSYDQIALAIGAPSASRAVGNAIAVNPVGYLIPCHRVVRKVGTVGDYRWGNFRKRALIAWEATGR